MMNEQSTAYGELPSVSQTPSASAPGGTPSVGGNTATVTQTPSASAPGGTPSVGGNTATVIQTPSVSAPGGTPSVGENTAMETQTPSVSAPGGTPSVGENTAMETQTPLILSPKETHATGEPGETAVVSQPTDTGMRQEKGREGAIGIGVVLLILALVAAGLILGLLVYRRKKQEQENARAEEAARVSRRRPQPVVATTVTDASEAKHLPYDVGCAQTIGRRPTQEDSFGVSNWRSAELMKRHGLLALVADGVGGMDNGQVASARAVQTMTALFECQSPAMSAPDRLLRLAAEAHQSVLQERARLGSPCGSTLVSALVHEEKLSFLSIGDSRIALYRSGALLPLNREHVLAREIDETAALSAQKTQDSRKRTAITSYLGKENFGEIDRNLTPMRLMHGDMILLMSDGVFGVLSDDEIIACLHTGAQQAAERIIGSVEEKRLKHQDNATVAIISYS